MTATTLQALELTNGQELAQLMERGAERLVIKPSNSPSDLIARLYLRALGRQPTAPEMALANDLVGKPIQTAGVEDLLWGLAMLPEFQLIY